MRAAPPIRGAGGGPVETPGPRQAVDRFEQLVSVEVRVVQHLQQPAGPREPIAGLNDPGDVCVVVRDRAIEQLVVRQRDHGQCGDRAVFIERRETVWLVMAMLDQLGAAIPAAPPR